jgi:hypothetical protein
VRLLLGCLVAVFSFIFDLHLMFLFWGKLDTDFGNIN